MRGALQIINTKSKKIYIPDEYRLPIAFFAMPLLPEYLAPLVTFVPFVFLVKKFRDKELSFKFANEQILLLLFLIWQFIGVFHSANKADSLAFSFLWVFMFVGFVWLPYFVKDRESLKKVVYAISLGGGLAGCIGVGQVFLMHYGHYIWEPLATVFNPFWGLLDSFLVKIGVEYLLPKSLLALLPHNAPIRIDARASSTFTNPIFLASYMVMTLPFAVYSIGTAKRKRFKALAFLCVVAIVGGVAGSYSRAPYLALGVTVFIMLFMGWKYALSVLAATPAFLIILPSGVYKRLLTLLDLNDGSIVTRADVWSACMETFRKKWLIGLGPGVGNTRQILINQYGIFQPHAHSLFLQLYLEGGVIGGTLFLALIVWIFVDIIILYARSKQNRPLAVTFFASLTGFLVCGITDYVLYGPKILQFFMLFLGLVVAAKRIYAPKGGENES